MNMRPPPGFRHGAPLCAQRGQSAVEFLILALALVPLFVTLPLLGKYLDLAHSTEIAARYVSFETRLLAPASTPKSAETLTNEVRRRFFSRSDAPIKSGDVAMDVDAHRNPLWTDHTGKPLLGNFTSAIDAVTAARADFRPAGRVFAEDAGFGLAPASAHYARVTVRPANVAALAGFAEINLSISRHHHIAGNSWAAVSSADVAARIERSGPAAHPIAPLALIGDTVGAIFPPLLLDTRPAIGRIDPEIIPCDRLGGRC